MPTQEGPPCACVSTLGALKSLPFVTDADGARRVEFDAPAGLCRFTVIADARDFDWERLYIPLHRYGNTGQRTGPWDFNLLEEHKPLVPSYWVEVDGHPRGDDPE